MQLVLKFIVASVLFTLGSMSWADCACFCADGKQTTMCSSVEEAQANTNKCFVSDAYTCPAPLQEASNASYEAPAADATNCRDMTVWVGDSFSVVKACDVLPAS